MRWGYANCDGTNGKAVHIIRDALNKFIKIVLYGSKLTTPTWKLRKYFNYSYFIMWEKDEIIKEKLNVIKKTLGRICVYIDYLLNAMKYLHLYQINMDICEHTFNWENVEILDSENTKKTEESLATWDSGQSEIDYFGDQLSEVKWLKNANR